MAYTAPRTWTTAELVTASIMNTHIRDNQLAALGTDGNTHTGNWVPEANNTRDLGATATGWRTAYLATSLVLNNGAGVVGKDTAGNGKTVLSVGGDNLIRIGWQSAPSSNGHLDFYANGVAVGRWFPSGGLFIGTAPADPGTGSLKTQSNLAALGTLAVGSTGQAAVSAAGLPSGTLAPRLVIPASAFIPASTNGATLALITTNGDKYELQYPDGANALNAYVLVQVPTNYGGGSVTVRLHWLITGISQAVRWNVDVLATEAGEDPDAAVANVAGSTATSNGTSLRMTNSTITWSSSLPTAGDMLLLRIQRDPTNAGDTSAATAKLREVIVEWGS